MDKRKKNVKESVQAKQNTFQKNTLFNKWYGLLVFMAAFLIYANTLKHDYTQDDAIVIYDNMFTTQGIKGLGGIFSYDTFYGFFKEAGKENLVSGGRYRPFTLAMFALEYQLAGKNPFLSHLINVLLFSFLSLMIYVVILKLFNSSGQSLNIQMMAFLSGLLFAVHPIHTEVVANIKGRDEIMAMLGGLLALYYLIQFHDEGKSRDKYLAAIWMFTGLLSKENTITYLAVIPLVFYFFRNTSIFTGISKSFILWIPALLFLLIRTSILGFDLGSAPDELMNNPFIKLVNGQYVPFTTSEKWATILFTLGWYIKLLIYPHPLTHDYYPRHVDIMQWLDWQVLLSGIVYVLLIFIAYRGFRQRSVYTFGILYFLATSIIISNLIFPIGTNMSERFMFMPSLGFVLILAYVLVKYVFSALGLSKSWVISGVILFLFSAKTFTRNMVWKDDFTLFTTDVKTSTRSAKVLNAAGGALTDRADKEKNPAKKQEMLEQAIIYLRQAIDVHPKYKNAHLLIGNALFYLERYEESAAAYEAALAIDNNYQDAYNNLAVALREAGKKAGEKENNLAKSESLLRRSLSIKSDDAFTVRLLGVALGVQGRHAEALEQFQKVVQIMPQNAGAWIDLANAYKYIGDEINAQSSLQNALSIDPNILKTMQQQAGQQ